MVVVWGAQKTRWGAHFGASKVAVMVRLRVRYGHWARVSLGSVRVCSRDLVGLHARLIRSAASKPTRPKIPPSLGPAVGANGPRGELVCKLRAGDFAWPGFNWARALRSIVSRARRALVCRRPNELGGGEEGRKKKERVCGEKSCILRGRKSKSALRRPRRLCAARNLPQTVCTLQAVHWPH